MTPRVTLFCIADDAGFRLLLGKGSDVHEVLHRSAKDFDDVSHEFHSSGRGRAGAAHTSFGHDSSSKAEIERPRFARHVVQALAAEWAKGTADRIVLAAGPKMLGALRDALPQSLTGHIAAELAKDLSDVLPKDLLQHMPDLPQV